MFTSIKRALIAFSMISALAAAGWSGAGDGRAIDPALTARVANAVKSIDLRVNDGVAEVNLKKDGRRILIGRSDLVDMADGLKRSPWAALSLVPVGLWILGPITRLFTRPRRRSAPRAPVGSAPVTTAAIASVADAGLEPTKKPALKPIKIKQAIDAVGAAIAALRAIDLKVNRYQPKHAAGARR